MRPKELAELLSEVGHVAEVSRLISVVARRRELIGTAAITEVVNRTAGAGHRYPNPGPALELALRLGLLRKQGRVMRLTELGVRFAARPAKAILDISRDQGRLLLGLLLDDREIARSIAGLLRRFRIGASGSPEAHISDIPASSVSSVALLHQLGVLSFLGEIFYVHTAFEDVLFELQARGAPLSEEALWARLEAQRKRAQQVELRVVAEERGRLVALNRPDLAEAVVRISARDAGAGYDIQSFEVTGSPRLIEVKSSTGSQLRFAWSSEERATAARNGDRYWVYFVPVAHALPKNYCPVLLIRNPVACIRAKLLQEKASGFWVTDKAGATMEVAAMFSAVHSMVEWNRS